MRRFLLITLAIAAFGVLLTACGSSSDPFVGDWKQSDQAGSMVFHVDAPKEGNYPITWSNGSNTNATAEASQVMHFTATKKSDGVYTDGDGDVFTMVGTSVVNVQFKDLNGDPAQANFDKTKQSVF